MVDLSGFRPTEHPPRLLLAPGDYVACIVSSTSRSNRSGTDSLELCFEILEGPSQGRQIRAWLHLHDRNELTVQYARAELSAICRAVGVLEPTDSTELHGIPLVITVRHRKRRDTGETQHYIAAYRKQDAPSLNTNLPWRPNGR